MHVNIFTWNSRIIDSLYFISRMLSDQRVEGGPTLILPDNLGSPAYKPILLNI